MSIHGWSRDCQSNSDVREYSDIGKDGLGVSIRGRSGDCQSNSSVQEYFDMGGL